MKRPLSDVSDDELIATLRRQADIWFNNPKRLMFDELIHRYQQLKKRPLPTLVTPEGT